MSTPPPYRPRTALHDEDPPPYTGPPSQSNAQQSQTIPHDYHQRSQEQAKATTSSSLPYVQELSNTANPLTYTLPSTLDQSMYRECRSMCDPDANGPLPNNSRKSRWQKLKYEIELRKAKTKHVTHEQAARMLGHDEEWQHERSMGRTGANGWDRKGQADDRGCVVM